MHFILDWRSFLYFLLVLFQHWNETCLQYNNIVSALKKSLLEWISAGSLVKHCVRYTFWDKLEVKIRFIPPIRRQNISQHAAEIILQTQRVFFPLSLLSFSPLPGLTLTACWSEPWLGIFANSSLRTPSPSLPFAASLPDSHTRLILSLGSYKPC